MEPRTVKEIAVAATALGGVAIATPPPVNLLVHPDVLLWWMSILMSVLGLAVIALLWAARRYLTKSDANNRDQWSNIRKANGVASTALDEIHQLRALHDYRSGSPFCPVSNPDRLELVIEKAVVSALNNCKHHHARAEDRLPEIP